MFTYIISLATLIGINAILAVTLNFILGYAGIFSLAHAIFFGIGAYTAAIAAMKFGADFAVATAAGMIVSGVISLALALPALSLKPGQASANALAAKGWDAAGGAMQTDTPTAAVRPSHRRQRTPRAITIGSRITAKRSVGRHPARGDRRCRW